MIIIAGPCIIENDENVTLKIAEQIAKIDINIYFKASFDKANRTSWNSIRGIGIEKGLKILAKVKSRFGLRITTDIHEPPQADLVKEVCDIIQIPALLCRQTDLLAAAAKTGKIVNVKKGQFCSPQDMQFVVEKLRANNCREIWLTERGSCFGYGKLINDMGGIPIMKRFGVPVIFDATHSVQERKGQYTGGNSDLVECLAKSSIAAGADGIFLETHFAPETSPSDGENMINIERLPVLLKKLEQISQIC